MRLQAVRGIALSVLGSTLLLTGSRASEPSSLIAQSSEQGAGTHAIRWSGHPSQARADTQSGEQSRHLRVDVLSILEGVPDTCGGGDAMRLVVFDGDRETATHSYCSAYSFGGARLISDARGNHFVLLEHGEGRGTRATNMYLTVFELNEILNERARLLIEEPAGIAADSIYQYRVESPPGGGIILTGAWTLNTADLSPYEAGFASHRSRQILEIDTSFESRQ